MTDTRILLKRNNTGSVAPVSGNLAIGELALNVVDGGLWYHNSSSDVPQLVRTSASVAVSSSYALTSSFALNSGVTNTGSYTGSFTGAFTGVFKGDGTNIVNVVSATHAVQADNAFSATTASFAVLAGQIASGSQQQIVGTITGTITGTVIGAAELDRSSVVLTTVILSGSAGAGSTETGSFALGASWMLYQVSCSSDARVRLYRSASSRNSDLTRSAGTDPLLFQEHGVLLDLYVTGSFNNWFLAPLVWGATADVVTPKSSSVAYTINNLALTATSISVAFSRLVTQT